MTFSDSIIFSEAGHATGQHAAGHENNRWWRLQLDTQEQEYRCSLRPEFSIQGCSSKYQASISHVVSRLTSPRIHHLDKSVIFCLIASMLAPDNLSTCLPFFRKRKVGMDETPYFDERGLLVSTSTFANLTRVP